MSKTLRIVLISAAVLIVGGGLIAWAWFSKHTSDVHLNYIPKDAAAVFSLHNREIAAKLDPAKLASSKPAQYSANDIPDFLMNIMAEPMSTGIDPVQNVYGFVAKQDQSTASALVLAVDDQTDFTAFVKKMFPDRLIEEVNESEYLNIDDNRALVWNDEAALFISTESMDIRAYSEKLFAQGESGSIKNNEDFTAFNAKTFDAGLYTDNRKLSGLNMETSALALIGMGEGHSEFFMRFEQNEIVTEFVNTGGTQPGLTQSSGPSAEDLQLLGMKDPLIYIGTNFNVQNLLTSASNDPMMSENVAGITTGLGLTQEQMAKLFTGTMTAAVTDYRDIYETDPRVKAETAAIMGPVDQYGELGEIFQNMISIEVPVTVISFGITNEKMAVAMLETIGMKPQADGFYAAPGVEMVIYAAVKSNHLIITNDYVSAQTIMKEGKLTGKLPTDYASKVTAQPFSLWLDLDRSHMPELLLNPKTPMLDPADIAAYTNLSEIFNGIRYESAGNSSKFHFTMPSSEENSLMRMIKYASSEE
jgi:hypothetical protein